MLAEPSFSSRFLCVVARRARGHSRVGVPRCAAAMSLVASLFLSACATTGGMNPGAGLPLLSPDEVRDEARLLAMFDTRARDTVLVDQLLASTVSARRARAALVVGQNAIRARYPQLRRLLVDPDTAVAANAAFALGLGKDSASIVALGRAFAGAPDPVAREAAWALGEIGEAARAVITIALGEGMGQPLVNSTAAQRSPDVRAELLLAATKLRTVPLAPVIVWATDSADVVARAVAYVLGRPRHPGGVRTLLALASHRDEFLRQQVARVLVRESVADSLAGRARSALSTLLADQSPRVRANAARSIGTWGAAAREDFERALRDSDANVRVAASENVVAMFGRDDAAWRRAWQNDSTYMVRRTLLLGARRAGSQALADGEAEWAASPDWRLRLAVVDARSSSTLPDRMAQARATLKDPDARVRAAAVSFLSPSVDDSAARAIARDMFADPDVSVRLAAARPLARNARAADLPLVIAAYASAAGDAAGDAAGGVDGDARAAALRYIDSAWVRDSAAIPADVRARLGSLPVPGDLSLRAIVEHVTPMASWRSAPAVEPRPLADYERIVRRWFSPGSRMPTAVIHTERGDITLDLLAVDAPLIVDAFINLANKGFYRNTWFHRVVPNFVAQDGDPRGDGTGGPGYVLRDAYTRQRHERGCLGLATSGPDTGGSQYYLCHSPQPHLDGHYTVFGRVRRGFETLDAIVQGDRVLGVEIR